MIKFFTTLINYISSTEFKLHFKLWRWRVMQAIPAGKYILNRLYASNSTRIERDVFGIHFRSPIGLAAGIDRNGELIDAWDAAGLGFVEVGSITPRPQKESVHPNLIMMPADHALLNRAEIESDGVEQVIENIKRHNSNIVLGCNITKSATTCPDNAPREYLRLFRPLYQYVDYFSVNICCNSTANIYLPTNKEDILAILKPLFEFRRGQNQYRPILLKISPDMSDEQIDVIIDIMLNTPLDGIVATGGTTGRHMLKDSADQMHELGRTPGIVCGQPIKSRSIEVVKRIYQRTHGSYPIIGCGGISTAEDAKAMLDAGASLVQICTEFVYNGGNAIRRINLGLNELLNKPKTVPATQADTTQPFVEDKPSKKT